MAPAPTAVSRVRWRQQVIVDAVRWAGAALLLCALAVLVGGYALDVEPLRRVFPGLATMKANGALGLGLAGLALVLGAGEGWRGGVATAAAALLLLLGGLTVAEYLLAIDAGIDELLFRDVSITQTSHPGRMSPLAATSQFLAGLALLLRRRPGRVAAGAIQALSAAILALALVALAGYAYDVQPLYRVAFYTSMAFHSAAAHTLLGLALLLSRPDAWPARAFPEESAQGRVLRHLLPLSILAPLVLGAVVYGGVDSGAYDASFALALFTLASGALLATVVLRTAATIGRAEATREEERRWLETTLASIGDGVIATDAVGRVVLINEVAASLTGWDAAAATGRPLDEVFSLVEERTGAPRPSPVEGVLRAGSNAGLVEGSALRRRGGERVPIDDSAAPIRDASRGVVGAVLVFRDVRATRAAASALRESEAGFRSMFETAGVGAAVIGARDRRVERVNRKMCAMLERRRAELVGADWAEQAEDAPALRRLAEQVSSGREREGQLELRCVRSDGSRFWAITTLTALRGADGAVRGLLVVVQDVDDLKRYQHEVEAAARHKDQFLAMLGHELRNPLAAIRHATELQLRLAPGDSRRDWTLQVLGRQSRHMGRVIDDLLDVTRIGRGMLRLRREPVDVAQLLRTAGQDQRPAAEAKGVTLRVDAPPGSLWLDADSARLYQILDNLLGNAIKFTDAPGEVVASVAAEGEQAVLRVRDTGAGIEPGQMATLFDAFQQAAQSIDRPRGGLGLGLTLVKGLVELHEGAVAARSEGAGRGAEFEVRLPLRAAHDPGAPTAAPAPAPGRRVLVVEDNRDVALSLRTLLDLEGHQVSVAGDGEAAMAQAHAERPEVVLCDIGLPGQLTGYDVARAFRAEPSLRQAHLVAVTGYGSPEDRARAREAGFDQVLVKPVGMEEVAEALRAAGEAA